MKKANVITLDEINQYFYESGGELYWKIKKCNCTKPNTIAGGVRDKRRGYKTVMLKYKHFSVHRILYQLYHNIEQLDSVIQIDHIDRNPINNSKENLRLAIHDQNQMNRIMKKPNKSGHNNIGVERPKNITYFTVHITTLKKHRIKKYFPYTQDGLQEAIIFRNEQLKIYHGEFTYV